LAGHQFQGPAVVAQDDTTSWIPEGFSVSVDAFGHLRAIKEQENAADQKN
jgi:N-methylhydantoinase A